MSDLTLVIGDKAYSSWSLRPWLVLKQAGLPFAEIPVRLRQPETKARIAELSPSGLVPVLKHGDLVVWDSLAIAEYAAELAPQAGLWPDDRAARAAARAVAAEMHSGFAPLRMNMPMDLKQRLPGQGRTPEVEANIARITSVWRETRTRWGAGGPFLFGRFTIADAMYAPVVTRFATYVVELDAVCRAYADAILDFPAMKEWTAAAQTECQTECQTE